MICPSCEKERASREFRYGQYKTCSVCRKEQRERRAASRNGEVLRKSPEDANKICAYCIFEDYCKQIVWTPFPVMCQDELTLHQFNMVTEMLPLKDAWKTEKVLEVLNETI